MAEDFVEKIDGGSFDILDTPNFAKMLTQKAQMKAASVASRVCQRFVWNVLNAWQCAVAGRWCAETVRNDSDDGALLVMCGS